MIFSLQDGKRFYQWDRERVLLVLSDEVNQVHFTNDTVTRAIIKDVYTANGVRVVDVPSVLLQHACNLTAYAYIAENEKREYTLLHEEFRIIARKQPDDYVPPEEYDRWVDLKEEILQAVEDAKEAIKEAANGMSVTDDGEGHVSISGVLSLCTADHEQLQNRELPDQHPIESITGLKEALEEAASQGAGVAFETDETLTLENGVLSVNTADSAEPDNTLPITSAAVATQVGNIEIILATI